MASEASVEEAEASKMSADESSSRNVRTALNEDSNVEKNFSVRSTVLSAKENFDFDWPSENCCSNLVEIFCSAALDSVRSVVSSMNSSLENVSVSNCWFCFVENDFRWTKKFVSLIFVRFSFSRRSTLLRRVRRRENDAEIVGFRRRVFLS